MQIPDPIANLLIPAQLLNMEHYGCMHYPTTVSSSATVIKLAAPIDLRMYFCQRCLRKDKHRSIKQQKFRELCDALSIRPCTSRLAAVSEESAEPQVGNLDGAVDKSDGATNATTRVLTHVSDDSLDAFTRSMPARIYKRARKSTARLRAGLGNLSSHVKAATRMKRNSKESADEERLVRALISSNESRGSQETTDMIITILTTSSTSNLHLERPRRSDENVWSFLPLTSKSTTPRTSVESAGWASAIDSNDGAADARPSLDLKSFKDVSVTDASEARRDQFSRVRGFLPAKFGRDSAKGIAVPDVVMRGIRGQWRVSRGSA